MSWPLPLPAAIAGNAGQYLAGELARIYLARSGQLATVDSTSPNSLVGAFARTTGLSLFDAYLFLRRIADEMMPDTAQDWLPRHAALWNVPQLQPVAATGNAFAFGSIGLPLPSGISLTAPGGALYVTTAAAAIGAGDTVDIPVQAVTPGVAGNLAAGTVLTLVSPIGGLTQQSLVVDSNGVSDGQDLQSIESWQTAVVARIRQRGSGGAVADYKAWMQEVLPGAIVGVSSPSAGFVTVAFAMPGPRVPTVPELAAATAYLTNATVRKPITAQVNVIAATLLPVNVGLHMIPDTTATRAAAITALTLYFQADGAVDGLIDMSRLDNAVSAGSGEFAHDRIAPTADIAAVVNTLPMLGTVTFA
jgi:uncharacterized phage protein gp47/JayE